MVQIIQTCLPNRELMHKIENIFVAVFMTTLISLTSVGIYWLFIDNRTPIKHTSVKTTTDKGVETNRFKRGETMLVTRVGCYESDESVFFSREFFNKKTKLIYILGGNQVQVYAGCRTSINRVQIPTYMEPGEYEYKVTVHYQNNPIIEGSTLLPVPVIIVD